MKRTGVKVYLIEKTYVEGTKLNVEEIDKDHADFGMVREQTDKTINSDRTKYYSITLNDTNGETISLYENIDTFKCSK